MREYAEVSRRAVAERIRRQVAASLRNADRVVMERESVPMLVGSFDKDEGVAFQVVRGERAGMSAKMDALAVPCPVSGLDRDELALEAGRSIAKAVSSVDGALEALAAASPEWRRKAVADARRKLSKKREAPGWLADVVEAFTSFAVRSAQAPTEREVEVRRRFLLGYRRSGTFQDFFAASEKGASGRSDTAIPDISQGDDQNGQVRGSAVPRVTRDQKSRSIGTAVGTAEAARAIPVWKDGRLLPLADGTPFTNSAVSRRPPWTDSQGQVFLPAPRRPDDGPFSMAFTVPTVASELPAYPVKDGLMPYVVDFEGLPAARLEKAPVSPYGTTFDFDPREDLPVDAEATLFREVFGELTGQEPAEGDTEIEGVVTAPADLWKALAHLVEAIFAGRASAAATARLKRAAKAA
ncbi:hypothetical protein CKO28_14365 [Rhodovibrio sodomensis]|uniref:Uncharacterized protein n=1 Tax=Rhodovibrio sodomensis TaxID=1088 RepID=A0ABS1DHK0_9PROT|nr:hypothetical protein [Rhodovibrio sodomensis]